jgi:hypothetical protein
MQNKYYLSCNYSRVKMTTMTTLTKVILSSWNLCYEVIMSLTKIFLCPLNLFEVTRDAVINILSEVPIAPLQTLLPCFKAIFHIRHLTFFLDLAHI